MNDYLNKTKSTLDFLKEIVKKKLVKNDLNEIKSIHYSNKVEISK